MLSNALHGLRDVDDVLGSFLLSREGELVARDLPAVFHAELFAEVGPRLVRLRETLDPNGHEAATATLRFAEHKLHLRALGPSLLCVLTGAKVNAPALRMAMNLVARRVAVAGDISSELDEVTTLVPASTPPPAEIPASASPRTSVVPPSTGVRRDVLYRGRRPG
jgi:predicted regulator of Ras-like GTPase activity (Roadblock/LC7/MglB family)